MSKKNEAAKPTMEKIADAGKNLEIWRVSHQVVREQAKNARVMPPEAFERLGQNMKDEGRLESLPFGVMRSNSHGKYIELISGHHRVRAAYTADIPDYLMLVDTREDLSADMVRSKQLSHNSLSGADDTGILAEIYGEIDDLNARMAAFMDDDIMATAMQETSSSLVSEQFEISWPVVSIAFLPTQRERFEAIYERLAKTIPKDSDTVCFVPEDMAQRFTDTINKLGKCEDVRTMGGILSCLLEIADKHLDAKEAEDKAADDQVVDEDKKKP